MCNKHVVETIGSDDYYFTFLVQFFFYKRFFFQSSVVFIRGLSKNTTEDGLRNYLENTRRSGGGPVEELKMTGNSARVKFESSEGNYTICCVRRAWNHVCSERKPTDMGANFSK